MGDAKQTKMWVTIPRLGLNQLTRNPLCQLLHYKRARPYGMSLRWLRSGNCCSLRKLMPSTVRLWTPGLVPLRTQIQTLDSFAQQKNYNDMQSCLRRCNIRLNRTTRGIWGDWPPYIPWIAPQGHLCCRILFTSPLCWANAQDSLQGSTMDVQCHDAELGQE